MWEYDVFKLKVDLMDANGINQVLNERASLGWELVQIVDARFFQQMFIFKRQTQKKYKPIGFKVDDDDSDVPFPK